MTILERARANRLKALASLEKMNIFDDVHRSPRFFGRPLPEFTSLRRAQSAANVV